MRSKKATHDGLTMTKQARDREKLTSHLWRKSTSYTVKAMANGVAYHYVGILDCHCRLVRNI